MRRLYFSVALLISVLVASAAQAQDLFLVSASYGKNVIALCERDGSVLWPIQNRWTEARTHGPS